MSKSSILRYLGNLFLITGYQIMLWGDFKNGLLLKCVGGLLTIPFAIKLKLWDVLFLCAFFGISEISKLSQLFLVQSNQVVESKTHLMVSYFLKVSGADGATPPGFQFPVKELVACMKDLQGELTTTPFFCMIYTENN